MATVSEALPVTLTKTLTVILTAAVANAVIERDLDLHRVGVEAARARTRKANGADLCSDNHGGD